MMLIHKHVGAWMQTAALVSEDLALSFCPLGGGRSALLEQLLPAAEGAPYVSSLVAVGEVVVASRPDEGEES